MTVRVRTSARLRASLLGGALTIASLGVGCAVKHHERPKPAPASNQALYDRAKSQLGERRFERARQTLSQIGTSEVQSPELDPLVKITTADAYFYDTGIANLIEAQSRYTQFLTFYPSSPLAPYAQFQIGMCYFKQSPQPHHDQTYTRQAIDEFDKVAKIDPTGRFVQAAMEMRDRCTSKLATHDYQVALFYYRRRAWPAVVSRFRALLESYPHFERADAVYFYLGMSLIRAGNEPEGRIYLEKVSRDFPSSKYASQAKQLLSHGGREKEEKAKS